MTVHYTPYLEKPPLYLAILLASDSPLEMDHPPCKQEQCGDKCPASGLDAAIAKLRLAALMWQAFTAEQLRAAGLGRRSFRLEEEEASASNRESEGCGGWSGTATIKVHVIRTHYSVAELREPDLAQQNPAGTKRDKLHEIFSEALKAHGGPFNPACRPIVAGLILDSHYDPPTVSVSDVTGAMAMSTPSDVPTTLPMHPVPTPVPSQRRKEGLILAHAALGSHDPSGLSLGIFGSHLCYSWPSSLSEIPSCLLDTTQPPADAVGNDCGECESFWEACCVGQGAFLHEVGHAFGAPHSSGVMVRGYSPDWAKCFLARTAARLSKGRTRPPVVPVVPEETENECFWDVRDMLRFAMLEHFGSPKLKTPVEDGDAEKCLDAPYFEHSVGMGEDCNRLVIKCEAGIAQLYLNGKLEKGHGSPSIAHPLPEVHFTYEGLMKSVPGFDMTRTLSVEVLALNGRRRKVSNVWSLFSSAASEIRVPGTDIILRKRGISCSGSTGEDDDEGEWHWTVLLKKHACLSTSIEDNTNDTTTSKPTHRLVRATKLSVRVGCALDGAIVHYSDGTSVPCGPRGPEGRDPPMGGHQSRRLVLPRGVDIVKVAVTRAEGSDSTCLFGLRVWLANGKAMGALNCKAVGRVVETLGM